MPSAGQANLVHILQAKCEAGLNGLGRLALSPLCVCMCMRMGVCKRVCVRGYLD